MKFLIKFPTKGRPQRFFQVLQIYYDLISKNHEYTFLINIDSDDASMISRRSDFDKYPNLIVHEGNNKTKVEAINTGMHLVPNWDVLLLASDDMIPIVNKYDQIIANDFKKYFPTMDGVMWYNDGYTGNRLDTLSIMTRKYYDRFGYIYNPEYKSLWCDNEFTHVASALGKIKYIDKCIIKHEHPNNNKGIPFDEGYKRTEGFYHVDKQTFFNRQRRNFDVHQLLKTNPTQ